MEQNKLVYGKNEISNIVSIEQGDNAVELFIEKDGVITSEFLSSKYWILSNKPFGKSWVRLEGDLHYKWGKQFDSRASFFATRSTLRNEDTYSIYDPKEMCMVNRGITYFKGMKIEDVSVLSFDIETTSLDPNAPGAKVLLISTTYRSQGKIEKRLFCYDNYEDEGFMIGHFCEYVREKNPSVLLGHNIFCFDLPYLISRAEQYGVQMMLGRDGSPIEQNNYESKFRKEATQFIHYKKLKVYGRELIDTLFLSIKHDMAERKYDSYALKNIIKQEGLEKIGRVFYDANLIRVNYKNPEEWSKIKAYCVDDSDDSLMLYDKMMPAYFYSNQSIPKSFQENLCSASGSQINSILIRSYIQDRHSIPSAYDIVDRVEGGISFGVPGVYRNLLKVDLKSAYPSQILRFKLSDSKKDPKANFYKLVEFFAEERFKLKELSRNDNTGYYKARDVAAKLFLNSMYGLCNTPGLNFNSPELAKKITFETRQVIELALIWASGEGVEYWRNKCQEQMNLEEEKTTA